MDQQLRSRYSAPPRRIVEVPLPDGHVAHLRSITETERSQYEADLFNKDGRVDPAAFASQRRRLLCLCLCNAEGQRIFEPDEAELLAGMDGGEAAILYAAAEKHCLYANGLPAGIRVHEKKSEPTGG